MMKLFGRPLASNFTIESDADGGWRDFEWVKLPVTVAMTEVESWDFIVRLVTIVKRGHLVEARAHFPLRKDVLGTVSEKSLIDVYGSFPKFQAIFGCTECHMVVDRHSHNLDLCRVARVMEE